MNKVLNFMYKLMNYIGAVVLYAILISIAEYLIANKIVDLRYDWFKYIYWIGVGVISYYPSNFLLKKI